MIAILCPDADPLGAHSRLLKTEKFVNGKCVLAFLPCADVVFPPSRVAQSIVERRDWKVKPMCPAGPEGVPLAADEAEAVALVEGDGAAPVEGGSEADVVDPASGASVQRGVHQPLSDAQSLMTSCHRHADQLSILDGNKRK